MALAPASNTTQSRIDALFAVQSTDPQVQQRGRLVHAWNTVSAAGMLLGMAVSLMRGNLSPTLLALFGAGLVAFPLMFFLNRRGRVRLVAGLLLVFWLLGLGIVGLRRGPLSPILLFIIIPIVTAATVSTSIIGLLAGVAAGALYLLLLWLANAGALPIGSLPTDLLTSQLTVIYPVLMVVAGVVTWFLTRSLNQATQQAQEYAQELEDNQHQLEQRVTERTRELEQANRQLSRHAQQVQTSVEISQATTQLLNLKELLAHTTKLVQRQFAYYNVSIYLLDEGGRWITIQSSSGAAGAQMVEQSFRLAMGQKSIICQVVRTRQPYVAQDVSQDPFYLAHPLLPDARSEVALPLIVGDILLGALDVESNIRNAFDHGALAVLRVIANQLAIAIKNALKFQDEAAVLEQSSTFHRYSRAISMATSDAQVGRALMDYSASTPADIGRLVLIEEDPAGRAAWIVLMEGWTKDQRPAQPVGTRLNLADYALAELISDNQVILVEDVHTDPRANEMTRLAMRAAGVRSFALIPLHSGQRWLGVWIIGRDEPSTFAPRLVRSCQSLAQQAAVVMENLRLLEVSRQQAQRERTISAIGSQLRSRVTVARVLESTVQQIGQTLGAGRVAIHLQERPGKNNNQQPGETQLDGY